NLAKLAPEATRVFHGRDEGERAPYSASMRSILTRAETSALGSAIASEHLWRALLEEADPTVERVLDAARAGRPALHGVEPDRSEGGLPAALAACSAPARRWFEDARRLADARGNATVEPVHVLALAVATPEVGAALDDASADAESLMEAAEAEIRSL